MKTRVQTEELRQAKAFLTRLSGEKRTAQGVAFPPESYRYELSQVQILSTLLERLYTKEMLPLHELPLLEWRLLEAIGSSPGITAAEFSRYWVYDKVTVSRALRALKARDLVESAPHATDGRRVELRLTEAGQAAFNDQLAAKHRHLEALSSVLSEKEMTEFTRVSRKLIDHFRRVDEGAD
ncbi:MarR family transcriptional regulator (plasmid) [Paraburkholderia sp. PREW-6R]|uniref:MarR family winged helix-turn-helix transcriptional regulator n=1 Tax=Paraburkholderia sp. PREW-6R TaxID=3141544 RepID=UPI0031F4E3EE